MREAEALPGQGPLADEPGGSAPPAENVVPTEAIPDPTAPSFSQNGAVFVAGRSGTLGRCSGTSVNAPNLSVVITAGHCVHQENHWMGEKWVFVPGYRFGERPFDTRFHTQLTRGW